MAGWKKITKMIQSRHFGEVYRRELEHFFSKEGYFFVPGGKHIGVYRKSDNQEVSSIPNQTVLRKDQLMYLLKEVGFI